MVCSYTKPNKPTLILLLFELCNNYEHVRVFIRDRESYIYISLAKYLAGTTYLGVFRNTTLNIVLSN